MRAGKLNTFVESGSTRVRHAIEANGEQWFLAERYEFCECPFCDSMHWKTIDDPCSRIQDAMASAKRSAHGRGKYTGIYVDEDYTHFSY